mmetsp:Transcript_121919/g.344846  ORF Transcript_121919/g.344846 Transcript_121919/m.344846 type:complete len:204 (+) Transcript_121919:2937-3548(+)
MFPPPAQPSPASKQQRSPRLAIASAPRYARRRSPKLAPPSAILRPSSNTHWRYLALSRRSVPHAPPLARLPVAAGRKGPLHVQKQARAPTPCYPLRCWPNAPSPQRAPRPQLIAGHHPSQLSGHPWRFRRPSRVRSHRFPPSKPLLRSPPLLRSRHISRHPHSPSPEAAPRHAPHPSLSAPRHPIETSHLLPTNRFPPVSGSQ